MAKKPSFFEKLTGANWSEKESLKEEPEKKPVIKARKNKTTKEMPIEKETPIKKKEKTSPPKKESEDWLTESEGQLTIDVYQTPNEIVIKSTIAGVSPEDIDISITNDMITIKGRRQKDEEVKEEDYYYQECYWGPFSRSVILPVDVEVDRADASMKNGILTIRLPKVEKVKTKKITIKAE
ncbi:MAG: Hsp20/alpha crystallin family protein [Candidatus Portnoybacteria bacterium]|nr:Hsp20/alpha crystallin family protein [Candidatus Portnoybacteria bacterium]